jgi:hypothetical protein
LNIPVEMTSGSYGEFTVLVDGRIVLTGGKLTALGVLPLARRVVDAVRKELSSEVP